MEIQQPSDVGQATARFTGLTRQQVEDTIRRIYPYRSINANLRSKDGAEALSVSGEYTDFNERNHIEGNRILQGIITNPWSSIHDVQQGKADPFYFDTGYSDVADLIQDSIGHITGEPQNNDPRLTFTENLLKLKMFRGRLDSDLSYNYMTNLFLTQVENGSTYYQTQARRQNEALTEHATNVAMSRPLINQNVMLKSVNMGNMKPPHEFRKRQIVIRGTPIFEHHAKRARLDHHHEKATRHMPESHHKIHTSLRDEGSQSEKESIYSHTHEVSSRMTHPHIIGGGSLPHNASFEEILNWSGTLNKSRTQIIDNDSSSATNSTTPIKGGGEPSPGGTYVSTDIFERNSEDPASTANTQQIHSAFDSLSGMEDTIDPETRIPRNFLKMSEPDKIRWLNHSDIMSGNTPFAREIYNVFLDAPGGQKYNAVITFLENHLKTQMTHENQVQSITSAAIDEAVRQAGGGGEGGGIQGFGDDEDISPIKKVTFDVSFMKKSPPGSSLPMTKTVHFQEAPQQELSDRGSSGSIITPIQFVSVDQSRYDSELGTPVTPSMYDTAIQDDDDDRHLRDESKLFSTGKKPPSHNSMLDEYTKSRYGWSTKGKGAKDFSDVANTPKISKKRRESYAESFRESISAGGNPPVTPPSRRKRAVA